MVIKKPTFKTISLYIVLFCLFTPSSLYYLILPDAFSYLKYVVIAMLLVDFVLKKKFKYNLYVVLIVVLHGVYIVSNLYNGITIMLPLMLMANNIGWMICFINIITSKNRQRELEIASNYFVLITSITVCLCFVFPNGLYNPNTAYDSLNAATTFLGFDNGGLPYFFISCFFATACYILDKSKKRLVIYTFVLMGVFVVVRGIATGIIACIMMLVIWLLFAKSSFLAKNMGRKIFIIGCIFYVLILGLQVQQFMGTILGSLFGKSDTLGRLEIWIYATEKIREQPLLGYGYNVVVDYNDYYGYTQLVTKYVDSGNAHNVVLQQLLWGGIIALVFFIWILLMALKRFDKHTMKPESRLLMVLIAGFILRSMVEIGSEYYFIMLSFLYYIDYLEDIDFYKRTTTGKRKELNVSD